jgi:hypothetical protein
MKKLDISLACVVVVIGLALLIVPSVLPEGTLPAKRGDAELKRLHEHQKHVVGRMADRIMELEAPIAFDIELPNGKASVTYDPGTENATVTMPYDPDAWEEATGMMMPRPE